MNQTLRKARGATEAPQAPVITVRGPELNAGIWKPAEFDRTIWLCVAPAGSRPEDFHHQSGPFVHVAAHVRRFDRLELQCEDGTWWAEYLAIRAGEGEALFTMLKPIETSAEMPHSERLPHGVDVRKAGPMDTETWCVWRGEQKLNVGCPLYSEPEAILFAWNHATVRGDVKYTTARF